VTTLEWLELVGPAALAAGILAIAVPAAIERFGGLLGGILGTMPSTILPASLGIYGESESPEAFVAAMGVVPLGMLLNVGFLYSWRVLPPRVSSLALPLRVTLLAVITVGLWCLAASLVVIESRALIAGGVSPMWLGLGATAAMVFFGVLACRKNPPGPRGKRKVSAAMHLSRGLLAGLAIGVSVGLAAVVGPVASGVASIFPAIFMTTMVALTLAQGAQVQAGAVGPMMLGSSSVAVFALLAAQLFTVMGPELGVLVSWIGSLVLSSIPAWWWLRRATTEA
jgi:hypothetical protein